MQCAHDAPLAVGVFDVDDLTRLVCPRVLRIFAGDDRYASDADAIADRARAAYREGDQEHRLHVDIATGGHALTAQRARAITDWVSQQGVAR